MPLLSDEDLELIGGRGWARWQAESMVSGLASMT